jgi:hypothetical protein
MMKSHILQEVGPLDISTEHSGSRRVNLEKYLLVQDVQYHAEGLQAYLWWRVRNQER